MKKVNCFISWSGGAEILKTSTQLRESPLVGEITIIVPEETKISDVPSIKTDTPFSSETILKIAELAGNDHTLLALQSASLTIGQFAVERMVQVAEHTGAVFVYADYYEIKDGQKSLHPVIDYQEGSLRDDFDFGPVLLVRSDVLKTFQTGEFSFAGLYALRLHASRKEVW